MEISEEEKMAYMDSIKLMLRTFDDAAKNIQNCISENAIIAKALDLGCVLSIQVDGDEVVTLIAGEKTPCNQAVKNIKKAMKECK